MVMMMAMVGMVEEEGVEEKMIGGVLRLRLGAPMGDDVLADCGRRRTGEDVV
jgi:hypothetical protein